MSGLMHVNLMLINFPCHHRNPKSKTRVKLEAKSSLHLHFIYKDHYQLLTDC